LPPLGEGNVARGGRHCLAAPMAPAPGWFQTLGVCLRPNEARSPVELRVGFHSSP